MVAARLPEVDQVSSVTTEVASPSYWARGSANASCPPLTLRTMSAIV